MSTDLPPLDARVRAQEYMQTVLHARLEELAGDMRLSFKQVVDYELQLEQKIDRIEANMVTKEEFERKLEAMESRILGAFQELLNTLRQAGNSKAE